MRRNAANWSYYVQVDCANDAAEKVTLSTIEKIVQQADGGKPATSFSSVEMEPEDATDG